MLGRKPGILLSLCTLGDVKRAKVVDDTERAKDVQLYDLVWSQKKYRTRLLTAKYITSSIFLEAGKNVINFTRKVDVFQSLSV